MRYSDFQMKKAFMAEIDVAHDCPVFDFMAWIEKYGLSQDLVASRGPGGGNPCFRVYHTDRNILAAALSDWHDDSVRAVQEHILPAITR